MHFLYSITIYFLHDGHTRVQRNDQSACSETCKEEHGTFASTGSNWFHDIAQVSLSSEVHITLNATLHLN